MVRISRNAWFGRRASMAPGPGSGVLLKKLRSRFSVRDARYWSSTTVLANISCWMSALHWFLRALGRCRFGVIMFGGPPGPTVPNGWSNDSVGFVGLLLKVNSAAIGGLFVRNVNEFIWLGL